MRFKVFHTKWNTIIISSLVICIAVNAVTYLTFRYSEQLLLEKTTNLIYANLSKDNAAISNMLYDVQKISAVTSTNSDITKLLSEGSQSQPKHSFLDYSTEDLNRMEHLEEILRNYRNTLFDYQIHMVIFGTDGSLYSVLDGVGNRYQFTFNFATGLQNQDWFQEFLNSNTPSLWKAPYYYQNSSGVPLSESEAGHNNSHILFCRKIYDYYTQQELGVAIVSLLGDNLRQNSFGSDPSTTGLVNPNGNIIYSSGETFDSAYESVFSSLNASAPPKTGSNYVVVEAENGESFVSTSKILPFGNWRLVHLMPLSSVTQEIQLMRNNAYTVSIVVLLFAVLLCALMLTYIMRPYNRIFKKMNQIQIGKIPVGSHTEKIISVPDAEQKFDQMVNRIEEMTAAALEKQALEEKMRYETLRAQLDPHFLFNTLNTIKWSALASGAGNIADMIACLGRVLESAMSRGNEDIPLSRELALVQSYLQIKNWTLKHRYELLIDVPDCFAGYPVFKYCLQPIVENAIIHGMEGMENGIIHIRAHQEQTVLLLEVHNNGKEMAPEEIEQILTQIRSASDSRRTLTGVGLSSIDGMVKLRYGAEYGISIDSGNGQGTTVTIRLPSQNTQGKGGSEHAGTQESFDR